MPINIALHFYTELLVIVVNMFAWQMAYKPFRQCMHFIRTNMLSCWTICIMLVLVTLAMKFKFLVLI